MPKNGGYIDKRQLLYCFIFTFAIGLIAHAYAFLNFQPSHDSLNEVISDASYWQWKIQLGRYLKPFYDMLLGSFASFPWTNGLISLIWLSLSGYLVTDMLKIKRKSGIALVCGIMTANLTVTALAATYMPDLSSDMLALFLALLGCCIWCRMISSPHEIKLKRKIASFLCVAVCVFASMGIYQAYVCVFITMVIIISVMRLTDGSESLKKIWLDIFRAAGAVLVGGAIYYVGLRLSLAVTGLELSSGEFNSLSSAFASDDSIAVQLFNTIWYVVYYIIAFSGYAYPLYLTVALNILIMLALLVCFIVILSHMMKEKADKGSIITLVLLCIALPFAMNAINLLSGGVHVLMVYAMWFAYVLAFLFAGKVSSINESALLERITVVLMCCLIFMNVQTANAAYVKKTTEQRATLSLMTRVIDRIEEQEGYEKGITPVAFIGNPNSYFDADSPFEKLSSLTGLYSNSVITYADVYDDYIEVFLKTDVDIVDKETGEKLSKTKEVEAMPAFPEKGSIKTVDGTVVVKFSDNSGS